MTLDLENIIETTEAEKPKAWSKVKYLDDIAGCSECDSWYSTAIYDSCPNCNKTYSKDIGYLTNDPGPR